MNLIGSPHALLPERPKHSRVRRVVDLLLGKAVTLVLAAIALAMAVGTFALLARGVPPSVRIPGNGVFVAVLGNLFVLLLLGLVLAGRLTRVWVERRRGSAGSRLHIRLVLMFGLVAVIPAIVVAVFSAAFFHFGIQTWFADPVRTTLLEAQQVARGYLQEHESNIRADALKLANILAQAGQRFAVNLDVFAEIIDEQTNELGLNDAILFEPNTGNVIASAGLMGGLGTQPPPPWAVQLALQNDVAVWTGENGTLVRALVLLPSSPPLLLQIGRPVDTAILEHMAHTEQAVADYQARDASRFGLQVTFALIFGLVAMLVLLAAALVGLMLANQIARPIGRLITAAERVRAGDLSVRVPEAETGDEVAGLSRAFNRMTGQLSAQRGELMDAYQQIDERRRFTEAVLSGVSAGVIGLDPEGRIELPNRAASELLGIDLLAAIGTPLDEAVPEMAPLLLAARESPERARTAEIQIGPPPGQQGRRRTLLLRVGADPARGMRRDAFGFVATFDDITELQSAQRKAAWADVARRIAHEIKNPLTPIQLSAERLKRRFAREITSDPETFAQCADTIVRHVGDIGRMVDEFSAFARMPVPVVRADDIGRVVREALVLQRSARPEIDWVTDLPERGPVAPCDRRLLGQALTNLLQNAADALAGRPAPDEAAAQGRIGRIEVRVGLHGTDVAIAVADDGIGLPRTDRDRLTEPYVTHKPKGTGLGLAIVKKIMEDHGGRITLEDRLPSTGWGGTGTVATLFLPQAGVARELAHAASSGAQ